MDFMLASKPWTLKLLKIRILFIPISYCGQLFGPKFYFFQKENYRPHSLTTKKRTILLNWQFVLQDLPLKKIIINSTAKISFKKKKKFKGLNHYITYKIEILSHKPPYPSHENLMFGNSFCFLFSKTCF